MKQDYAADSDSDIEVTRRSTDSVKKEEESLNENETVYRNKRGKRISKEEYNAMKGSRGKKKKEEEEMEWASGLTQKYQLFEKQMVAQRQRYSNLNRYRDDAEMNVDLQNEKRAEDPLNQMEGYRDRDRGNGEKGGDNTGNGRPMYRGKPWPNRYGILPGYRWDGVDRSNGFEQKKLLHQSRNKDLKKKRYKWANEDM